MSWRKRGEGGAGRKRRVEGGREELEEKNGSGWMGKKRVGKEEESERRGRIYPLYLILRTWAEADALTRNDMFCIFCMVCVIAYRGRTLDIVYAYYIRYLRG